MTDADRALMVEFRRGLLLMANAIADRYDLPRVEPAARAPREPVTVLREGRQGY